MLLFYRYIALLLAMAVAVYSSDSSSSSCSVDSLEQADLVKLVSANKESVDKTKDILKSCIDTDLKLGSQLSESLVNSISSLKRDLSDLSSLITLIESELSVFSPAFEWAQSADTIFISVKFAHKLDTPACIDVINDKITISSHEIFFEASCKGKKKRFELPLKLWGEIDESNSTWSLASVGRASLTLRKKNAPEKWDQLLKPSETNPRNMHTWWVMAEKYQSELAALGKPSKENLILAKESSTTIEESKNIEEKKEEDEDLTKKKLAKKAKKLAKSKINKLKKKRVAEMKNVDKLLLEKKKELEEEMKEMKTEFREEIEEQIGEVEDELEKTLERIKNGISEEGDGDGGILAKLTSLFSGSDSEKEDL